jgi:hypothetical protein
MKQGYLTSLCIGNYGRFMNGGYQIAAVLGIAKRNNLEPVFKPWINADHRDRFGSTEDVDLQKYFVHDLPPIPEGIQWQPEIPIQWGYHDVTLPSGNWNISGHFQSPRYFDDCRDHVSHYFRMKDEPPQSDYVAIHVRLGDYDNGYHPRLDMQYYGPAMAMFPGARFLVFSDDIPACKGMFGDAVEYSEGRDYILDFKLMKTCRDFVIGNSSYSAMAAILGDHPEKRVVAPRPWFGPRYTSISGDDIYDHGWMIIQWQ